MITPYFCHKIESKLIFHHYELNLLYQMNLNNKHINIYKQNGVIVLKKIFKKRDIQNLKERNK